MINHQIISRANAGNLTDADMQAIKAAGLRVVHRHSDFVDDHEYDYSEPFSTSYDRDMDDAGHKESDFI